jgi:hypothetical protein
MKLIEKVLQELGSPYEIKVIDFEEVIYRKLNNEYDFEVSGISGKTCTLYVWALAPQEIVGVYNKIPIDSLKDVLGYYAVRYQNLSDKIQVEREDQIG